MSAVPRASSPRQSPVNWRRFGSQAQDIVLVFVTALFVVVHATHALGGDWKSVPFAVEQAILIVLFLRRRRSTNTTTRPLDWLAAAIGGWLPLAMRLHSGPDSLAAAGFVVQLMGIVMVILCFSSLGRSFGIVAANRGLKTAGPYRLVRHPIYLSHLVVGSGFLLTNPYWWNYTIFVVVLGCQLLRMRAEERVLTSSAPYADYRARVRWRLVPFIY